MKNVAMGDEETTRSGLFFEAIRIIKEMRNESFRQLSMRGTDVDIRLVKPRYAVYENVPGAFSSNGGADFQAVLEETAKVAERDARIPGFEKWGGVGLQAEQSWEMGGALLGEYTMLSFGECPSVENESLLSQILEDKPHPKYSLSAKACQGILNRAQRRGKKLPEQLLKALENQAHTPSKLGGGVERDCYGKKAGKGPLVQTELSATLGVSQDQTLIKVNGFDAYNQADTGEVSKPLTNSATDADHTPIVYGISAYDSNSMKSSNPDSGIYEADTTRTLDNNGGNPACNQGGMIVLEGNGARPSHRENGYVEGETMYTLNGTEHHAVCVEDGKKRTVYDWHRQDTRMTELKDVCVTAAAGWGRWWK